MERVIFTPKNEQEWLALRLDDITSTEISCLFGISPYMSEFELWHRKKNKMLDPIAVSDRMKWGTRLQDSIAKGIAEDKRWNIKRLGDYERIPALKIGSSFDFMVFQPEPLLDDVMAILEIKNVDSLAFKEGWTVDEENIEAPLHIELQVQHQLLVSGLKKAYIGALVGGNRVVLIERNADENVHKQIITKVQAFWKSNETNQEPQPDFKRDAKFIASLYQSATPEKTIPSTDRINELAKSYQFAQQAEKEAHTEKESFKAELLTLIGDAEKVKGDDFSISANIVGPCHIEYEREGYRNFKVTFKKFKGA